MTPGAIRGRASAHHFCHLQHCSQPFIWPLSKHAFALRSWAAADVGFVTRKHAFEGVGGLTGGLRAFELACGFRFAKDRCRQGRWSRALRTDTYRKRGPDDAARARAAGIEDRLQLSRQRVVMEEHLGERVSRDQIQER